MEDLINFGFINIDKPIGPTSFSVSNFLKRELNIKKTSHMGTLDPNVSGVLPIALGRACKLSGFLIGHDKEYIGILQTHKENTKEKIQEIINKTFLGEIIQTPPHKSAVKRAPRKRTVYKWEILETINNKEFLFITKVEGGTYIRKLCSDLGEIIGGAHMAELRRIKAGFFSEEKIYTLYEFQDALLKYRNSQKEDLLSMIYPAEEIIKKNFPIIKIKKESINSIKTGKKLISSDILNQETFDKIKENSLFSVFYENDFLEIAIKLKNQDFVAKPVFVYN